MSNPFVPIKTADLEWRDDLPFSVLYDDVYFSAASGIGQCRHVFIDGNNLIQRWQELPRSIPSRFNIGETGFGSGLNFLLTWSLWEQYAPSTAYLHFISCEKHPLKIDDLRRCLSLWPELSQQAAQLVDNYPVLTPGYHHLSFANGHVNLTLMIGDALESFEQLLICGESILESQLRTAFIDAWYLDGFAPKKNESMWTDSLLKVIALLSKEGTTLATYTAAASVKSIVRDVGFTLVKKKGFAQKRHMISAYLEKNSSCKIKNTHTPWHVTMPAKQQEQSAIIVGAGLAGSFTAYSLAQRGWQVTIIDEQDVAGKGGSANTQAVLFPKLSAYKSPLTQLMLMAFIYAQQLYKNIVGQFKLGELNGILLLAYNEKEKKIQQSLDTWLHHYPELGMLIDNKQASDLAGLSLEHSGLFIPQSGWINSPLLCQFLIKHQGITLLTNRTVDSLNYENNQWVIHDTAAPVLILANGPKVSSFKETKHLPIKVIRGQMSCISSTASSNKLLIPICAEGHILPEFNGVHHLGATYDLGVATATADPLDDKENIIKLKQITDAGIWSNDVVGHWAGVRASTPDYLPLVGQVPKEDEFIALFADLETNSKRWIAKAGPYYPGLYICAGFGSRGLTTIPLCAEWLAASINNEMSCLPRNLIQSLSPARFLRRNITRGVKK